MCIQSSEFLELAKQSINDFGADITLRQVNDQPYDPLTGDVSSSTVEQNTKGLIEDFSEHYIAEGLAKLGDKKITLAALSLTITPEPGNKLIIAGSTFDVISVKTEMFSNDPILYILQIRD